MRIVSTFVLIMFLSFSPAKADVQDKRKAFIAKSIKQGYFHKVTVPGQYPQIHIRPKFLLLPYDDKVMLVNVVYSYYVTANSEANIVTLVDYSNNESIGRYTLEHGLSMD